MSGVVLIYNFLSGTKQCDIVRLITATELSTPREKTELWIWYKSVCRFHSESLFKMKYVHNIYINFHTHSVSNMSLQTQEGVLFEKWACLLPFFNLFSGNALSLTLRACCTWLTPHLCGTEKLFSHSSKSIPQGGSKRGILGGIAVRYKTADYNNKGFPESQVLPEKQIVRASDKLASPHLLIQ